MSHIRTNAHPVILTGGRNAPRRDADQSHSLLLDAARDTYDGDLFGWGMDLLFATQVLRMAWDSPRIGGGIDPALATGLPSYETARDECTILLYVDGLFDGMNSNHVQDMIVHAEAVALRCIALAESEGKDY